MAKQTMPMYVAAAPSQHKAERRALLLAVTFEGAAAKSAASMRRLNSSVCVVRMRLGMLAMRAMGPVR